MVAAHHPALTSQRTIALIGRNKSQSPDEEGLIENAESSSKGIKRAKNLESLNDEQPEARTRHSEIFDQEEILITPAESRRVAQETLDSNLKRLNVDDHRLPVALDSRSHEGDKSASVAEAMEIVNDTVILSEPETTELPVATTEDDESLAAIEIETQLCGLFYLINLALYLDLYGDFTRPSAPGIELNI